MVSATARKWRWRCKGSTRRSSPACGKATHRRSAVSLGISIDAGAVLVFAAENGSAENGGSS
jgi:hypothetical protein